MENNSYLGKGWSSPPEFNRGAGSVFMSFDEDDSVQRLRILLSTSLGERVHRYDYDWCAGKAVSRFCAFVRRCSNE